MPLYVERIKGSGGRITYFFIATGRAIHVGHFRAVSPSTDPLIYMDARKNRYQSRRLSGGRVRDASHTAFLTHSSERHGGMGRATWCLPLAIAIGMDLIATCRLPLHPFPQQFIPCALHTKQVIKILYHIITMGYESDHWHGLHLRHVEHRYY